MIKKAYFCEEFWASSINFVHLAERLLLHVVKLVLNPEAILLKSGFYVGQLHVKHDLESINV